MRPKNGGQKSCNELLIMLQEDFRKLNIFHASVSWFESVPFFGNS